MASSDPFASKTPTKTLDGYEWTTEVSVIQTSPISIMNHGLDQSPRKYAGVLHPSSKPPTTPEKEQQQQQQQQEEEEEEEEEETPLIQTQNSDQSPSPTKNRCCSTMEDHYSEALADFAELVDSTDGVALPVDGHEEDDKDDDDDDDLAQDPRNSKSGMKTWGLCAAVEEWNENLSLQFCRQSSIEAGPNVDDVDEDDYDDDDEDEDDKDSTITTTVNPKDFEVEVNSSIVAGPLASIPSAGSEDDGGDCLDTDTSLLDASMDAPSDVLRTPIVLPARLGSSSPNKSRIAGESVEMEAFTPNSTVLDCDTPNSTVLDCDSVEPTAATPTKSPAVSPTFETPPSHAGSDEDSLSVVVDLAMRFAEEFVDVSVELACDSSSSSSCCSSAVSVIEETLFPAPTPTKIPRLKGSPKDTPARYPKHNSSSRRSPTASPTKLATPTRETSEVEGFPSTPEPEPKETKESPEVEPKASSPTRQVSKVSDVEGSPKAEPKEANESPERLEAETEASTPNRQVSEVSGTPSPSTPEMKAQVSTPGTEASDSGTSSPEPSSPFDVESDNSFELELARQILDVNDDDDVVGGSSAVSSYVEGISITSCVNAIPVSSKSSTKWTGVRKNMRLTRRYDPWETPNKDPFGPSKAAPLEESPIREDAIVNVHSKRASGNKPKRLFGSPESDDSFSSSSSSGSSSSSSSSGSSSSDSSSSSSEDEEEARYRRQRQRRRHRRRVLAAAPRPTIRQFV